MASWLLLYSVGCVSVMFAVGFIAFRRRASHRMDRLEVAQLTFCAGLVWPLLAVAGMQAVALLALKGVLGSVRSLGGSASAAVQAPTLASVTTVVASPVAAAEAA